jgi:hypothetical protein
MLISTRRYNVRDDFIALPRWILAPLSLSSHKSAYLTINQYRPTEETKVPELVISAFPKELWGDLWRIQLQFEPGPGQVADLSKFLDERGLKILAFEAYEGGRYTEAEDATQFNSFHLIVSAHDYSSVNDGTSRSRIDSDFFRMRDLYDEMSVEFIHRLNFVNRKTPRLAIRRLSQHRILHRGDNVIEEIKIVSKEKSKLHLGSDHVLNREGDHILGFAFDFKRFPLNNNDHQAGQLAEHHAPMIVPIMPTADAHERLIRIIPDPQTSLGYVTVLSRLGDGPTAPTAVGTALRSLSANIIKVQIFHGLGTHARRLIESLESGEEWKEIQQSRANDVTQVDITFSWPPQERKHVVSEAGSSQPVGPLTSPHQAFWRNFEDELLNNLDVPGAHLRAIRVPRSDDWQRTFFVVRDELKPRVRNHRARPDQTLADRALKAIGELSDARHLKQSQVLAEGHLSQGRGEIEALQERELAKLTSKLQHIKRVALNQIEISKAVKGPSIFVSFSRNGAKLKDRLTDLSARLLGSQNISTGFDSYDETKLGAIWRAIAQCDAFIGIWTADYPLDESYTIAEKRVTPNAGELVWRQQRQGIPSPWLPFEWGMAVSLGKPYYLLVETSVPETYATHIAADTPHYLRAFSMTPERQAEDFNRVAEEALKAAVFRYFRRLGVISDFIDDVLHGS